MEGKHVSSRTVPVSIENLHVDGQDIYVTLNGEEFSVQSLEKTPSGWQAKVNDILPWCLGGHPACASCESCHKPRCPFYVPSCVN